jgi:hypothetical protein
MKLLTEPVIARDETIAKSVNNETLHHMSC